MFNTCSWSCPMIIQLLPGLVLTVGCGWAIPNSALLGWEMRMGESIAPLSFLNVTGRVQKAMAEEGEAFPWVCSPREFVPVAGIGVGCALVPPRALLGSLSRPQLLPGPLPSRSVLLALPESLLRATAGDLRCQPECN